MPSTDAAKTAPAKPEVQKSLQRTFTKEHPGDHEGLSPAVLAGYTSALHAEAKALGLEIYGETAVVRTVNVSGSHTEVTLSAKTRASRD
jgi:hypothetical protein